MLVVVIMNGFYSDSISDVEKSVGIEDGVVLILIPSLWWSD